MNFPRKTFAALSAAALVLASLPADAQVRRGGWGHGGPSHWRGGGPGLLWGGVGLGIGLGLGSSLYYGGPWGPWGPGYVVVERPPTTYYYDDGDAPVARAPAVRGNPPLPEPVIYPRNGQSASQTELDRQACNRWATTQDSAMRDASVFQRATAACMDGRGYSVK